MQFFGVKEISSFKDQDYVITAEAHSATTKKRPWWKTWPAITIYSFLFLGGALGVRKYELSRIRLKNQMVLMHLEADKLKEVDQLKSRFFANISHELRTPLTLIKEVVTSFDSLAKEKSITLRFVAGDAVKSHQVSNNFYFSKDAIEKIIINLLHNALKFTPAGGKVTVTVCLHTSKNKQGQFEITIKDTGSGIPKHKIPFIYNRYYQIDDSLSRHNEGTGIGLAYVKELVETHKGHIAVMSKPQNGTTFRLRFPLGDHHYPPDQIDYQAHTNPTPQLLSGFYAALTIPAEVAKGETAQPVILIVEDNEELRNYITSILLNSYNVMEASNGAEGLELAINVIPDLIISDIIMPGADDYLTKPFNAKEMQFRVKNMIESRMALRARFDQTLVVKPEEIVVSSRDSELIEKLLRVADRTGGQAHGGTVPGAVPAGRPHSQRC